MITINEIVASEEYKDSLESAIAQAGRYWINYGHRRIYLDAGKVDRVAEGAAQDVEMSLDRRVRDEMHARFDDGLAAPLGGEPGFDCSDDFVVQKSKCLDVESVEISEIERRH